ncbi:hypothetical protein [Psychrobacter lutiphocae]|uniref:hypothetical protein n=1 Tax=Psychrobacter lutiphocae TaxID=540500 RepID=UPI0003A52044|nr:hypothetical protein [Psychrobacter lutiphocae]
MQKKKGFSKYQRQMLGAITVGSILGLTACQSTTGCVAEQSKCFNPPKALFKDKTPPPALNPQFNYIKLIMNGQTLWLAQGVTQQWPVANTQVFYSSDRSVFKWANGRLIAVTTPLIDWREHLPQAINWPAQKPFQFQRYVDRIEGILALPEFREVNESLPPAHHSYVGDEANLVWVHEYSVHQKADTQSYRSQADIPSKASKLLQQLTGTSKSNQAYASFDAWYAFEFQNMKTPVYGQQCISKQYCLSWQVWNTL